jgi:peptidoglycan/LPS O-acetylase OafA/YrhL
MSKTKRLFWLDFVRAISVLTIIVYHYRSQFAYQYPNNHAAGAIGMLGVAFGDLGVAMFIMISGAALMLGKSTKFDAGDFFRKRVLSIYPAYWVAFIVASIFCLILNGHLNDNGEYWKLILSVFAVDGFFLYKTSNYYVVGEWFVGFILFLYLLFPLLRPIVQRLPLAAIAVFPAIYLIALPLYNAHHFELIDQRNPLMRVPDFLFGMLFVRFGIAQRKWVAPAAALCIAALQVFPITVTPLFYMFLTGAIFFALFAAGADLLPQWTSLESLVGFFAKYSFMAFLLHHQIIYAFFGHLNLAHINALESNALCALIVILSFAGAIVLQPIVVRVSTWLSSLLYRTDTSHATT